jgi:pimeloyl-ACP methyl ester carboxylesterase
MTLFGWLRLGLLVSVATAATTEQIARTRARKEWKAPGALVDFGRGRRIQLDCRGAGSPTVVLEGGLDAYGSLSWALVHDSIATDTRVCAYSRAGIMWSNGAKRDFDSRDVARNLRAALEANSESAPFVMVGHSIGGAYVTTFTQLYGAEVSGLVLVDPSHPDQFARYLELTGKSLEPSPAMVKIGAALAWTGLPRLMPAGASPVPWPGENDRMSASLLPTSLRALAGEVSGVKATLAHAGELRSFGDRPVIVLTASEEWAPSDLKMMGLKPEHGRILHDATVVLHDDQASRSTRGRNVIVPKSSHYVQFTQPAAVTAAVREVVALVRQEVK